MKTMKIWSLVVLLVVMVAPVPGAQAQGALLESNPTPLILNLAGHYGGVVNTVELSANGATAYVGAGQAVVIVDTAQMGELGTTTALPATIVDLAVQGNRLYALDERAALHQIDVSLPQTPRVVSSVTVTGGRAVKIKENYAYVASGRNLIVFDLSTPNTMIQIARISLPSFLQDLVVSGNYAYILSYGGLHIAAISNPTSPTLVSSLPFASPYGLAVTNGYAYLGVPNSSPLGAGKLVVVNVQTPSSPVIVTEKNLISIPNRICSALQGLLLAANDARTFNLVQPADPVESGIYRPSVGNVIDCAVMGNFAYLAAKSGGLYKITLNGLLTVRYTDFVDPLASPVSKVFIANGLAFAANNAGELRIYSLANPLQPQLLSATVFEGRLVDVQVVGSRAYVAKMMDPNTGVGQGLLVLDISDPMHPLPLGDYPSRGQAVGVVVEGNFAYLIQGETGLSVINVSNPAAMQEVGFINTPGNGLAVQVMTRSNRTYVLVADGLSGVRIIDATNPAQLQEISSLSLAGFFVDLKVRGNYAYLANHISGYDSGLFVVDLTTITSPRVVANAPVSDARWLTLDNDRAYVASDSTSQKYLAAFSLSDPAHPVELGAYNATGNVAAQGGVVYHAGSNGLKVLDMRNLSTPVLAGRLRYGPIKDFAKVDHYGFITGDESLRVLDLTTPALPRLVQTAPSTTTTNYVVISGQYAYVTQQSQTKLGSWLKGGLSIFDISNPQAVTAKGFLPLPEGVSLQKLVKLGNYVYAYDTQFSGNVLHIINVANPQTPVEVGSYPTSQSLYDIAAKDQIVYLVTSSNRLLMLDVSNPSQPAVAATLQLTDQEASSIAIAGNYAYIGHTALSGSTPVLLTVINISNPASPTVVGKVTQYGAASESFIYNGRLYTTQVLVFDIGQHPVAPVQIGAYEYTGFLSVHADQNYIYASAGNGGLWVIRASLVTHTLYLPWVSKALQP